MPDAVYVLGAGASHAHGAPLTDEILPYALRVVPEQEGDAQRLDRVRGLLRGVFHVPQDVFEAPVASLDDLGREARRYPHLVDVLSMVDMALERKESLSTACAPDELRELRSAIEYVIYLALSHSLSGRNPFRSHSGATRALAAALEPDSVVISFNYDVIIDILMASVGQGGGEQAPLDENYRLEEDDLPIDYGVSFDNAGEPRPNARTLLKLHGSFNWLHSRTTGALYYGGLQKRIRMFFQDVATQPDQRLPEFGEERLKDLQPILVTPTHLKDLNNVHLAILWRRAEQALRKAQQLTFIGYSLPGDDLHIKYLFKRALETQHGGEHPKVTVVDRDPDGNGWARESYERFFGAEYVTYHADGFEAYAQRFL